MDGRLNRLGENKMADYTITLTDAQVKAMETDMASVQAYIQNVGDAYAYSVTKQILNRLVTHCNANSISIATGEAAQIDQAYELGLVVKADANPQPPAM